jgi:endonuclease YncB( thermonuclease family)
MMSKTTGWRGQAADTLIAWNGIDTHNGRAPPGSIAIGPLQEMYELDWAAPYHCTGGAADGGRRTMTGTTQRHHVMLDWYRLVYAYGVNPYVAHRAFRVSKWMRAARAVLRIIAFTLVLDFVAYAENRSIQGPAYVIDSDTVVVSGIHVRLKGVDGPELSMPGGIEAKILMQEIVGASLTCQLTGEHTHGREVGWCHNNSGDDIGAAIVRAGRALACPRFDSRYVVMEQPDAIARLSRASYCRVRLQGWRYQHSSTKFLKRWRALIIPVHSPQRDAVPPH